MPRPRLVVIAGPPNCGKIAQAWRVLAEDPELRFVHRDQVRVLFGRLLTEPHLTRVMVDMAGSLLTLGYGVVTAAQNQHPSDRLRWERTAWLSQARLEWHEMSVEGTVTVTRA